MIGKWEFSLRPYIPQGRRFLHLLICCQRSELSSQCHLASELVNAWITTKQLGFVQTRDKGFLALAAGQHQGHTGATGLCGRFTLFEV